MKVIELSKGQAAIVDDDDFEMLAQWRWRFGKLGYAIRNPKQANGKSTTIQMSRVIMGVTDRKIQVDHINMNRLDNRKCNLRLATAAQNRGNTRIKKGNTVGFKGVSKPDKFGRFRARIGIDGKQKHLGSYETPQEAHAAYCVAATEVFKEFARFN